MPKNEQAGSITCLCDYIPDKTGPLDREAKFNRLSKLMNSLCDWQTKLSGFQVVFAHFSAANRFGKQYSCIWFITTLPWTLWKHLKYWIRSSKAVRLQTRRLSRFFYEGHYYGTRKIRTCRREDHWPRLWNFRKMKTFSEREPLLIFHWIISITAKLEN